MPGNEWQLSASLYQLSFYSDSQGTHLSWDFAVWGSQNSLDVWLASCSFTAVRPSSAACVHLQQGDSVLALMRAKKKKGKKEACSSRGGSLWEPRLLQSLVATALVVVQPLTGWNYTQFELWEWRPWPWEFFTAAFADTPRRPVLGESVPHGISYQRSVRAVRIGREVQNIQCKKCAQLSRIRVAFWRVRGQV